MSAPAEVRELRSMEAEQYVLGALMHAGSGAESSEAAAIVKDVGISAADFHDSGNRRIFGAVRLLVEAGLDADAISVADRLTDSNEIELVGGLTHLVELQAAVGSWRNIRTHARRVRDLAERRKAQAIGREIAAAAESGQPLPEIIEQARGRLDQVEVGTGHHELDVVFADSMPESVEAADEIVEGMLTRGGGSVVYGDSNCGKTFYKVDMACAVARGVEWMGRRTEQGLVVYLAAEGPASVRQRLRGYQKYHGVSVPNFAIVQRPVDLFASDTDVNAIINFVRKAERERDTTCVLVVGDTLARLSAGANENSGEDMGLVVRRIDRLRAETGAHVALIHHSGKNQAAGARGWSGLRAAVDTEVEITDGPTGRCAEVTKQRDLPTKGDRIGFRLEVVEIGTGKWGKPVTTCVCLPSDAPARSPAKTKLSESAVAIMAFLRNRGAGCHTKELVAHLDGIVARRTVYDTIGKLAKAGQVIKVGYIVSLADPGHAD